MINSKNIYSRKLPDVVKSFNNDCKMEGWFAKANIGLSDVFAGADDQTGRRRRPVSSQADTGFNMFVVEIFPQLAA